MNIRKVSAGNGVQWITESVQLILKNPAPFALMGLVMAVLGVIPVLGSLALAVASPALYGGIAWAAREQSRGSSAQFDHLAQAFKEPGKIGPMLLLCLPGVIASLIIGVLLVVVLTVMLAGVGVSAATDSGTALLGALGAGGMLLLLVLLALMMAVVVMTFFAIPDVMFRHNDAFTAMKLSVRASIDNIGAVLVYLLVLFVIVMIVVMVMSVVSSLLAQLLVPIVLAPVLGASTWLAWKEIYGDVTAELPPVPPQAPDDGGMVA